MTSTERPLRILRIGDGVAGHESKSAGLCGLFADLLPVAVTEYRCRLKLPALSRQLATTLVNCTATAASARWLCRLYSPQFEPQAADLVISSGGNTLFMTIAAARLCGAQSVFIGSPRRVAVKQIDWLLSPEYHGGSHSIRMPLPPVRLDSQQLREAGLALRRELAPAEGPLLAVLLGGDGAGYRYGAADWSTLAASLNQWSRNSGGKLLLTSSRRTGEQAERLLRQQLAAPALARAAWYRQANESVLPAFLGAADAVLVTADSLSMIAEAVAAGHRPRVLHPAGQQGNGRHMAMLADFAGRGWTSTAAFAGSLDGVDISTLQRGQASPAQAFWHDVCCRLLPSQFAGQLR